MNGAGRLWPSRPILFRAPPRRRLALPTFLADKRYENNPPEIILLQSAVRHFCNPNQALTKAAAAYWQDEASAVRKLPDQGLGDFGTGRSYDDGVIRRLSSVPYRAVRTDDLDIFVTKISKSLSCFVSQRRVPLNGDHTVGDLRQNCGRIAGTRAHFQYPFAALQLQRFGHLCNDIGLGDGLAAGNAKRPVVVGEPFLAWGDEQVTRHGSHGIKNQRIVQSSALELTMYHCFYLLVIFVRHRSPFRWRCKFENEDKGKARTLKQRCPGLLVIDRPAWDLERRIQTDICHSAARIVGPGLERSVREYEWRPFVKQIYCANCQTGAAPRGKL